MKFLFLDSPSYGKEDIISAFSSIDMETELFYHEKVFNFPCKEFDAYFDALASKDTYAFCFSFNYYPSISNACSRNNMKYLSFVYDSPLVSLYSYTLINPCNYVFLFDKTCYLTFANEGIRTVYYLPLCADTARLDALPPLSTDRQSLLSSDVSFVGSLYNEKHNLLDRMTRLDDYTKGYLNGIMQAQQKINGYFFIEELLTPDVLDSMKKALEYRPHAYGTESVAYVYANYFLARKITATERQELLSSVSEHFDTKLYTHHATPSLPDIKNMGAVDYCNVMPYIFRNSKINLNITLRSIQSGMPLRAWDIMGAGGFLLSNYQADFLDYFVPGEDFDYYDGTENLLEKIEYYLSHEKERAEIAQNGYRKVKESHTYLHRVLTMLKTAEIIEI